MIPRQGQLSRTKKDKRDMIYKEELSMTKTMAKKTRSKRKHMEEK